MSSRRRSYWKILRIAAAVVTLVTATLSASRAGTPQLNKDYKATDTVAAPKVHRTAPRDAYDLKGEKAPADLRTPDNITTTIEYDPEAGMYVVRTTVGGKRIVSPFVLSPDDYNKIATKNEMQAFFRKKNAEPDSVRDRKPFDILDMNFRLGPLERVFGPGGFKLTTNGSIQLSMGITSDKTDNPAIPVNQRRKTYFNFDQKIQAGINASIGDKLKFGMNYNTDATFDFDSKDLRLNYEGHEDDFIKSIEAGNVSMTTGSSLIRGSASLFGIKTRLQFGRLQLTGLIAQQNSESKSVSTTRGVQTTDFSIRCDNYDANRHFFLAQYFYDNYDAFAAKVPYVTSGIKITRIEVWVTNKRNSYNESRNFVAFMDLGENSRMASSYWQPDISMANPSNASNNLLQVIRTDYPDARFINSVTQALMPLSSYGITGGRDYEKVESARKLDASEYTLNETLGYISLKSALTSDEVLAVAYEYSLNGNVYQVGEFSSDITDTNRNLYLKLLRATDLSPKLPAWKLMMKNIYSTGAYQLTKQNFQMDIKVLSDSIGTEITYLPIPGISDKPLLQLMNLDRLDSNGQSNPDGFFDYVEGYTVESSGGRIIFPVAEPFGKNLEQKIGDAQLAAPYVYKELYDSTLVVARQFADKNKFSLVGRYQASNGAQIRLNAMNVPQGSVVVTAGGTVLQEGSDYNVDYSMGIVTIINQSIIDAGTPVQVTLENQALFNMQRKTLLGLDAQYKVNSKLNIGASLMHFSEKALTEKVNIGNEVVNNTIWGVNFSYRSELPWLTNLLNKIPTVNAEAPSSITLRGEFAQLVPHNPDGETAQGSGYIDDFESTQTGVDLRNPYAWQLASTPYDTSADALFPEAALSNDIRYGYNRALLAWYYIDRMWTRKNSSLVPGYIRHDIEQLSNPYVREVSIREIYPNRDVAYGDANLIQTLNLSFYPTERGPYNLDSERIDANGNLLDPKKRWGGIMRKLDYTNFETSNVEYLQFWLLDPFLDPKNNNSSGGDLYFNFGDISEDILKDGLKAYENGNPIDGNTASMRTTNWGRVATQNSLTYAFENAPGSRPQQDLGLDGLSDDQEFEFSSYANYIEALRTKLSPQKIAEMRDIPFSPFNDPAGDDYHFYRSNYYDAIQAGILDRYKHYNGVEGNSLSADQTDNPQYQASKTTPDVEDINVDNTLNEYERYFQYHVSLRPGDLEVGKNYITDKQVSIVKTPAGPQEAVWYQFKIPLSSPDKRVGNIEDFSSVRFARIFLTDFEAVTHLRFASLELIRGEWRDYELSLEEGSDAKAEGVIDMSVVNIEENSTQTPVNYVLPPDVTRVLDPSQSQATQLNEQSLALKVTDLRPKDALGIYKNTFLDLRRYKKIRMWVHAEKSIDDPTALANGDLALFIRLGSDIKNNFYEYEIPLKLTPEGFYNNMSSADRAIVWPSENRLDLELEQLASTKTERNRLKSQNTPGIDYNKLFTRIDPLADRNTVGVKGNPSLSDVRVIMIGIRNRSGATKEGTIWVNELKVCDLNEDGGWAANVNANLLISDIATINFSSHYSSAGFGAVDEPMSNRSLDSYKTYNLALQGDMGRLMPEKLQLSAPIYYSRSNEKTTPKYNPLDQDILLSEALRATNTEQQRDSIKSFAVTSRATESFSLSNMRFNRRAKRPMPWDPANFQLSFSFSKQKRVDPTTTYETSNDYRGNLTYTYSPHVKPWKPFGKIKSKNKNILFIREWELNWLFNSLTFINNISRYYYELQARSGVNDYLALPLQVSKNFIWNRQLNLSWNPTRSLNLTFSSNTSARIEETIGAVNKKLFPDKYKEWRDTVWSSILHLGTPWNYNQTFTGLYRAPFSKIPALNFLTANVTYNSVYNWDRGATIDGVNIGNTVRNQSTWSADTRINFESFYNKIPILKRVNSRFSRRGAQNARGQQKRGKRLEKIVTLIPDSAIRVRHNMKSKKVTVTATSDGKIIKVTTKVIDDNNIEIAGNHHGQVKLVVRTPEPRQHGIFDDIADYALRFAMMPRNFAFRFRSAHSLTLPLFRPDIGDIFGQTSAYGPMSPGVGFAFGFYNEKYVDKAMQNDWLIIDPQQTSAAIWNRATEFQFDLTLEPISGLRIQLTSNLTDNRTQQIQFTQKNMPVLHSGSYLRTHVALASALRSSKAEDGYRSKAFDRFIEYIPMLRSRVERSYTGIKYPNRGFLAATAWAGQPYNAESSPTSATSADILIPAFIAAYSGYSPERVTLNQFPGLSAMRPNWRVTYDGLMLLDFFKSHFKAFTFSHAYQCTYGVANYSSFLNWVDAGNGMGFIPDPETGNPIPSSCYNIASVTITEKFAPLIGLSFTMNNDLTFSTEYRDSRTVSLNPAAGQIMEASSRQFTLGIGYKIAEFNKVIKIKGIQKGFSNSLTLNLEVGAALNNALIRRIETAFTQATQGSKTFSVNFMATYELSRRVKLSAFFDHQTNMPLVSSAAYPMSNTNYGIAINMSLAR